MPRYLPNPPYEISKVNGCWYWKGMVRGGYGVKWNSQTQKMDQASRYIYEKIKGPIPAGMHLDHLCRNRICVNPDHLEPVTNQENSQRGNLAKNSPKIIKEIRDLFDNNIYNQSELSKLYEIPQSTIHVIVKRKQWNNI